MDSYLISVVLLGSSLDFYMGTKVCNNRLKRQKIVDVSGGRVPEVALWVYGSHYNSAWDHWRWRRRELGLL